jgi:hypothetical protein
MHLTYVFANQASLSGFPVFLWRVWFSNDILILYTLSQRQFLRNYGARPEFAIELMDAVTDHGSPTALAPGGPAAKCENSSPTASHITLSESILDLYRDVHDC